MRDYEEKSYYEIQLDNKQLILVFLAGVTVCVLVFVLGVMVGKGKKEAEMASLSRNEMTPAKSAPDSDSVEPKTIQPITDQDPIKGKGGRKNKKDKQQQQQQEPETPVAKPDAMVYDKLDKTEETPLTPLPAAKTEQKKTPADTLNDVAAKTQEPLPDTPAIAAAPAGGHYTVQVMATGSKEKADQQLNFLKTKGYTAFMTEEKTASGASVYKVRVGKFNDSDSAKKIAMRLKQDLKLETWVAVLE